MIVLFSSCADYLDVVPDNTLTLEEIYTRKENAYNALAKVYNYLPREDNTHNTTWLLGDEYLGRLDYNNDAGTLRGIRIMHGLQTTGDPILGFWTGSAGAKHLYRALNQCEIFLNYIDLAQDMTENEIREWKAQVKFLKAYYCWILVRHYGPIVIPSEGLFDPEVEGLNLFLPHLKVEECFDYILDLMDEAIPDLTEHATTNNQGQVDQIVAKAAKARVLFFRASPFFNGNREYYGDFLDHNGEHFFLQTEDPEKWKEAAEAIKEAIDIAHENGKELYTFEKEPYLYDRDAFEENPENMQILYNNRMVVVDPWNKELVWGFSGIDLYNEGELAHSTNMRLPEGYGDGETNTAGYSWQWLGASYQMLERFYTKNGLPIDEDVTFDQDRMYDLITTPGQADPEYKELYGIMQPGSETLQMYMDREPRFYANMAITGGYWRTHSVRINTMMYQGRDGGFNSSTHTTDYFPTGIGLKKFVHPESTSGAWQRTIKYPYPLIRLADLYLMYAEALNEYYGPTEEVYEYINKVRRRAGVPEVQEVWRDASLAKTVNKHTTKEGMRDIILQERSIELAFEGIRFWDMQRHKRAVREFSSPIWGWKHDGATAQTFFTLEPKQTRRFTITDCLWPIQLEELNTNGRLIQNPGW
ncbi:MAG: RagB/SusD family nutrient uptake outer membrane protein [Tannerellaceae bacterium]|nr:RagB/SusD family nutrient uptake outer membrane protein [Tannerellaceae bacterium]